MRAALGFLFAALQLGFLPADTPPSPVPVGQTYAILVGGLGGDGPYGSWYSDWLTRFQTYLSSTARVPSANIELLAGKNATFAAVTDAFKKLASKAQPQDQLILFIVGHGEITAPAPRLTLPGPDPTPTQFAALLNAFPAKNQVVLNFSASSGDFLKGLAAPGRVNITATSPTETEEPIYAEFFLRGLESKRADADHNGTVTLLEAYNWAAGQTAFWIARWEETGKGTSADPTQPPGPTMWKASGRETIEIFEKLYGTAPTRKLDPSSDRKAVDAEVPLTPPGGKIDDNWYNRRVVDEHAQLEDLGQGLGVSVITNKGLQLILGQKPGDPGYVAAHTVLGVAAPLSP